MSGRGTAERLILGASGQMLARIVNAANSVALVPVLIHAWGLSGYGQWMALTALASFLGYSNFGLASTSCYEMVMAAGAGDALRARRAFQVSINLTFYVFLPIIAALLLVASATPLDRWLKLSEIGPRAAFAILALTGAQIWLQTLRSLIVGVLNAVGSYGFAYTVNAAEKAAELAAVMAAVLLLGARPLHVAAILTALPIVEVLVLLVSARRRAEWARFDLAAFDTGWIARQARPAVGFLVSNLCTQSALVQGPRVVLAALLGGQAVAIYSVYSTAMRLVDQLLMLISTPLEVEFSRSVGRAEPAKTFRMVVLGTQFGWLVFMAVAAGLLLFGPWIFKLWTQGRVDFEYGIMALVILMSGGTQIGRMAVLALTAANRMYGPSFVMLALAGAGLALGAVLARPFGVAGVVTGSAAGEIANSLFAVGLLARWLDRPMPHFFHDVLDFRASFRELLAQLGGVAARFSRRNAL